MTQEPDELDLTIENVLSKATFHKIDDLDNLKAEAKAALNQLLLKAQRSELQFVLREQKSPNKTFKIFDEWLLEKVKDRIAELDREIEA